MGCKEVFMAVLPFLCCSYTLDWWEMACQWLTTPPHSCVLQKFFELPRLWSYACYLQWRSFIEYNSHIPLMRRGIWEKNSCWQMYYSRIHRSDMMSWGIWKLNTPRVSGYLDCPRCTRAIQIPLDPRGIFSKYPSSSYPTGVYVS